MKTCDFVGVNHPRIEGLVDAYFGSLLDLARRIESTDASLIIP